MEREEAERVARAYAPMVYRLAYARTGSRADAEDAMQEVFLRLVRKAPVFECEEHCRNWLLRVTVNCVSDVFRAPWRRHEAALETDRAEPSGEEEGGVLEGVLKAVLALPTQYRIPVHLHYYEALSVAEIARTMGKSEGVIKTRLFRARAMLKKELEGGKDYA